MKIIYIVTFFESYISQHQKRVRKRCRYRLKADHFLTRIWCSELCDPKKVTPYTIFNKDFMITKYEIQRYTVLRTVFLIVFWHHLCWNAGFLIKLYLRWSNRKIKKYRDENMQWEKKSNKKSWDDNMQFEYVMWILLTF